MPLATVLQLKVTGRKKAAETAPPALSPAELEELEERTAREEELLSQLVLSLLTQGINDFLNPDYDQDIGIESSLIELDDIPPCGCDPDLCPISWVRDGFEPFLGMRKECSRFRFLEKLPEFSPKGWLLSSSEETWSFRWCCVVMGADPEIIRDHVLRLPKSRRGITISGRKLYKTNGKTHPGRKKRDSNG